MVLRIHLFVKSVLIIRNLQSDIWDIVDLRYGLSAFHGLGFSLLARKRVLLFILIDNPEVGIFASYVETRCLSFGAFPAYKRL